MSFIPFDDLWEEAEFRFRIAPNWENSTTDELVSAFSYFCEQYWKIRHPKRGCIAFKMSDAQRETVRDWLDYRFTIILKARQLGFSTLAGAFTVWCTYFYGDRHIIMLSKTERDAIKLLAKSKYGFKKLPEWMKTHGPIWEAKQTSLAFSNDSVIESLPSGNDPARGEGVWAVVVDEWAHLPNPDEAWAAIEPIADIGGRILGLSSAKGEGNIFYTLWSKSAPYGIGENDWRSIFHDWRATGEGLRDDEWYAKKKRDLPDWQLAQEYPDNPEEAFLRSGRAMFKLDKLRAIECIEPQRGFLVDFGNDVEFREDGGAFAVWDHPLANGVYTVGVDVAEGLEHGDYTSVHVIDARNKRLVAHWHGHIDPDLLGIDLLPVIGRFYNNALMGVESNNHGLTTLKALQRAGYRNIFVERPHGKRTALPTEKMGFRTTKTSKPLLIDGLNTVLRDETLWMRCAKTLQELKTFVREGDGKMHGSPWDDRTISIALAVHMLQFAFLSEYTPKVEFAQGTMGWLEKVLYKKDKPKTSLLGEHSVRLSA